MTWDNLFYFIGASVALTIAPGPDNIFVLTQGITSGRRPAIISALGMCSGVSVHTAMAALGVSAIFYSSALAFNIIKYAGAAYLLYLAYLTLKNPSSIQVTQTAAQSSIALFRRGFIMNVLNPKVGMFFLAFLPQFVTPGASNVGLQMMLLGTIFMVQAVVIFTLIGYFSGSIGQYVLSRPRLARVSDWVAAGVFTSLGLRLALADR